MSYTLCLLQPLTLPNSAAQCSRSIHHRSSSPCGTCATRSCYLSQTTESAILEQIDSHALSSPILRSFVHSLQHRRRPMASLPSPVRTSCWAWRPLQDGIPKSAPSNSCPTPPVPARRNLRGAEGAHRLVGQRNGGLCAEVHARTEAAGLV